MEGAGAVGGLLWMKDAAASRTHAVCYDGNGNVTALIDSAGVITARYDYGPFGQTVEKEGLYSDENPFRFSTKYGDAETGLYYYGYRFYDPETGRWLNRDPIEEEGGLNIYGFIGNRTISRADPLGLRPWEDYEKAVAAMKDALQAAHDESLAQGKSEIDIHTGKTSEWHTLRNSVGNNYVSKYYEGKNADEGFIEVVLATEFGSQVYCYNEDGKKWYNYVEPVRGRLPTREEARGGDLGVVEYPPTYFPSKEFAPPALRSTAKLIANAHTHPEFWRLDLGRPGVHPVRNKKRVGPSDSDVRAARALPDVVGNYVISMVYDDNQIKDYSTGYEWHEY